MTELLTAAQMRAIEQAAIQSGEVTGLELMERAGAGVVEAIFEEWPALADAPGRAVVLCGPGNNGGDGFVVARLLAARGWSMEVYLYGDAEKLPPDARVNYDRWCESGVVFPLADSGLPKADIVVDALFGTGLTRPFLDLPVVREIFNKGQVPIVAVDLPSGLCADSGRSLGGDLSLRADLSVTFHRMKLGHVLQDGAYLSGKTVIKGIGLQGTAIENGPRPRVGVKPPPMGAVGGCPAMPDGVVHKVEAVPDLLDKHGAHKFSHGHALILSGGSGKTGAARLAARGALRIGAGLVTVGVPPSAQMEVAAQITALMLTRVCDGDALAKVLEDTRLNALCLGPGLGHDRARCLVPVALASKRACVLDADGLSAYADDPQTLFDMLHDTCVLTPHGGEFARLFPDIAAELAEPPTKGPAYSKVDATRAAAKRAGCTVLFKGADTVIATPDGRTSVHSAHYGRAAPWLATAGAGDVFAGFTTGLLARGFAPHEATTTAAYLHVECARTFGPGLIAEDLPEQLPIVLRDLFKV
ncbi:NAD(P)H-hydrate dehydratase [Thalassobius sp. Cn5-15]|uniref:NAD(P)H-hydrate dehydratase n=1 Tax=Thalassobius sp. Cn5-15 TaxID=2917763 RepID=UPI001EF34030|nr:NAD(P)H-hydrate dehydratase [Thalassobius sp. Cn5-15]MCG7492511.1 NAD(P)H-hydrate dehydratase [Thalassobius sp. Cn5-15]